MNVIISNSIPLNGGDEALLEASILGLKEAFPEKDLNVTVLTNKPFLCSKYLNQYHFNWDYEYTTMKAILKHLLLNIRRWISGVLFFRKIEFLAIPSLSNCRKVSNLYKQTDIILLSAGGYFHDFYDYSDRLKTIKYAMKLNKKVVVFGQSVGPFWKQERLAQNKKIFNAVDKIILRENLSNNHLTKLGVNPKNIIVTTDIAFLLNRFYPMSPKALEDRPTKNIALNFRFWVNRAQTDIILAKAVQFCKYLIRERGISITFLSTCQGIKEYTDDNESAQLIVGELDEVDQDKCTISALKYSPKALIAAYSKYDLYIGMRLHGAILSMLGGVPAMNIGYEDKTEGIYSTLGLDDYQVHYQKPLEDWVTTAQVFIDEASLIRKRLPGIISEASTTSWQSFLHLRTLVDLDD